MTGSGYIKGIDGLRAFAVLSVLLFHLDANLLHGGFTGVDIFFVISGYVVAKSLSSRNDTNFTEYILSFYKRRIIRIYPALLILLLVTSAITIIFIPQFYLSRNIEDTGLTAFFGFSNIVLALNNDTYFSPTTEFNPFVHTWSLGVEEQFYLIFPLLFYFWLKNRHRLILPLAGALSIIAAIYHTHTNSNHAYYFISSRFWELAAGAMLLQYHVNRSPQIHFKVPTGIIGALGLALALAGLVFSKQSEFPIPWAFLPVTGSCLLIHFIVTSSGSKNILVRGFESTIAVHLGKLSYSLYLWHWPVFTFFRWSCGLNTPIKMLIAATLTYALSVLSYYCVEQVVPKLIKQKTHGFKVVAIGACSILICFAITKIGFKYENQLKQSVTAQASIWSPYVQIPPADLARGTLKDRTLFVIGDSHAGAYQKMLLQLSQDTGINVKVFTNGGCPISSLLRPVITAATPCQQRVKGWINFVLNNAKQEDIIFLASLKLERVASAHSLYPGDRDLALQKLNSEEKLTNRALALEETKLVLQQLEGVTHNIIMDAPKPIFNFVAFRCADWFTRYNPICQEGHTEQRQFIETLRAPVMASLQEIQSDMPNVSIWDPLPALCTAHTCSVYHDAKPMFFDTDHLSGYGNRKLYPSFKNHLLTYLGHNNSVTKSH